RPCHRGRSRAHRRGARLQTAHDGAGVGQSRTETAALAGGSGAAGAARLVTERPGGGDPRRRRRGCGRQGRVPGARIRRRTRRPHDRRRARALRKGKDDMIQFGYKASSEQFAPRELLRYTQEAEAAGFDSVFFSDHLQPWRHHGGHAPAALPWLGAAAASTERITIGTGVLTPTLRYHPALIAQAFATLGCLAPGRVILGVGTGESMNETPLGIDWPAGRERRARLREGVALSRQLWNDERVTFDGDYYQTQMATIYDLPAQQVPIYVAASGPIATRMAGEIGDGYITTSGKGSDLYTEKLLQALHEGIETSGPAPRDLAMVVEVRGSF